ncbi:protein MENT isoform X2 [Mus caroli]|uniref:Protein MENT isoform X2 n=1 Tax=Mus caroli TaxID=10089 RepID=A0A6P5PH64_MUSCR|nr:protein MENT isoform X2 [Mus caroli]
MVPAACMLLWALLLSLESRAAGAEDQTTTPTATTIGMQRVSFRFGGPSRSLHSTNPTARTTVPGKLRVTLEDENDALATADRLALPAAAELLSTVTGYSRSSVPSPSDWEEDGSLEEGVVDTRRTTNGPSSTTSLVPVHLRRRPILPPTSPSPSPALAFWKRVRIGLEDIWNSLSSVFTETQPVERIQR